MTPFTIGVPVYNEEAILVPNTERLIAFLDGLGPEYEVFIGSNGSTDSTTALGGELSRRFKQVTFFHTPERGVGLAFREVVRRARHPFLVSVDMDLSIDLDFISTALRLLETNDVVVGSKKMGNQQRSFFRKLGSDSFLRATRLLLGLDYDDYSIAAKAFRVETVRRFADRIDHGSSYVLDLLPHEAHGWTYRPGAGFLRGLAQVEVQPAERGGLQVRSSCPPLVARSRLTHVEAARDAGRVFGA